MGWNFNSDYGDDGLEGFMVDLDKCMGILCDMWYKVDFEGMCVISGDNEKHGTIIHSILQSTDAIKVHAGLKLTATPPPTSFGISTHAIHSI